MVHLSSNMQEEDIIKHAIFDKCHVFNLMCKRKKILSILIMARCQEAH